MATSFREEVLHNVAEFSFGVKLIEITGDISDEKATYKIVLLEGKELEVFISRGIGYQVINGNLYESMEALLSSQSPMYIKAFQDKVLQQLSSS